MFAGGNSLPEYDIYRSPSQSPAQRPIQNQAVAAAEQRVQAAQAAVAQPAAAQFQYLGGSRPSAAAMHGARIACAAAFSRTPSNASSPGRTDATGTSAEGSPLPTRLAATAALASTSRAGPSTSRTMGHATESPSTPTRRQTATDAEDCYASPAAMPPPGAFREPGQSVPHVRKPPLSSRKRVAGVPPLNAPFKLPKRG
jgi:hypothetical protein